MRATEEVEDGRERVRGSDGGEEEAENESALKGIDWSMDGEREWEGRKRRIDGYMDR